MDRDKTPKTVLEPNTTAAFLPALFGGTFLAAFFGYWIGLMSAVVLGEPSFVTGVGVFVVIMLLVAGMALGNIMTREYRFYDDQIEIYEGFLKLTHDVTSYERITDVSFSENIWQRLFGVGTVRLNTAGSNRHEIAIKDIEQPQDTYQYIRKILETYRARTD